MSTTINKELTFDAIRDIYDQDKFYIAFFKNLLTAVINEDFSIVSRSYNEIENIYNTIRNKVQKFVEIIGSDFYTGVPDSQLKALCNYLMHTYGIDPHHHIIAAI